jgi:hypothetical protein
LNFSNLTQKVIKSTLVKIAVRLFCNKTLKRKNLTNLIQCAISLSQTRFLISTKALCLQRRKISKKCVRMRSLKTTKKRLQNCLRTGLKFQTMKNNLSSWKTRTNQWQKRMRSKRRRSRKQRSKSRKKKLLWKSQFWMQSLWRKIWHKFTWNQKLVKKLMNERIISQRWKI